MGDSGKQLAGLILAAGAASRYGSVKQLAELGGIQLVVRAARSLVPVCDAGVLVVTGAYHEAVADALAGEAVRCLYNPAWREGIGASLRQGIGAFGERPAAVLVALADQPGLQTAHYQDLVNAWLQCTEQPAAAVYAGAPGVPAIFPRSYWHELAALRGDRGARGLLRAYAGLTRVDMPAAAWDVDEPADLDKGPA